MFNNVLSIEMEKRLSELEESVEDIHTSIDQLEIEMDKLKKSVLTIQSVMSIIREHL